MPASSGAPTTPTKAGWHLVDFANGDVGVVQWTGSRWNWTGGLNAPASPIVGVSYLGSGITSISSGLAKLSPSMPPAVWQTILSSLDHGDLMNNKPLLVTNQGKAMTGGAASASRGPTSQAGSEAVASNIVPSPDLSNLSIPNVLQDIWSSAVGDAKYAGVLIGCLALGALLIFHAFSGGGGGGGGEKIRVVPIP